MSGVAPIVRANHAAVFGDRPQPVDDAPDREVGGEPKDDPEPGSAEGSADADEHDLTADDRSRLEPNRAIVGDRCSEQSLVELPAGSTGGVAPQLAAKAVGRDRIPAIEGNVGFVRSELVAMVRHVASPVRIDRGERGKPDDPAPDEVVQLAIAEEHAMRGFMHQCSDLRMASTGKDEGDDPNNRMVDPNRADGDADDLRPARHDGDAVADRGNAPHLVAKRSDRATVWTQARVYGGAQRRWLGEHRDPICCDGGRCDGGRFWRGGHDGNITLGHLMSQERNTLSPRSLMLSLLLGMRRPRRPASELVAWCGLFGVPDGTARVALSRMVRAGELRREGPIYELAGRVRDRSVDQAFSLAPQFVDDRGSWWMELVTAESRTARDRSDLRLALRHAGFAERREGVWLRPANLERPRPMIVAAQCERLRAEPENAVSLARELFDPAAWGVTARSLRARLRTASARLDRPQHLAAAFVTGARVVSHLRADPLLPHSLIAARDLGDELRDEYRTFQRSFGVAVNAWFESQ